MELVSLISIGIIAGGAFLSFALTLLIIKMFEDGKPLSGYYKKINQLSDKNKFYKFIFKPLGTCEYCMNAWVAGFVYALYFNFLPWHWIVLFIAMSQIYFELLYDS